MTRIELSNFIFLDCQPAAWSLSARALPARHARVAQVGQAAAAQEHLVDLRYVSSVDPGARGSAAHNPTASGADLRPEESS